MKNYFVHVKHGRLDLMIAIRGDSQIDVENYIMKNKEDLECHRVSDNGFDIVRHEEGWRPSPEQIWYNK